MLLSFLVEIIIATPAIIISATLALIYFKNLARPQQIYSNIMLYSLFKIQPLHNYYILCLILNCATECKNHEKKNMALPGGAARPP